MIFINKKCLKGIASLKTKKTTKPFQRKNVVFYAFLNIYIYIYIYIYRSSLFHSYYRYQLNSKNIGPPDNRKSARGSCQLFQVMMFYCSFPNHPLTLFSKIK